MDELIATLYKAYDDQMKHGKTTLIEAMQNQEPSEPFRRNAMKKPVEVAGISKSDMRPYSSPNENRSILLLLGNGARAY